MPASASLVRLEHAKTWAKRLLKASPALGTLSACQEAVARMLGHANWHAMEAYYSNQEPGSVQPVVQAQPSPGGLDEMFEGVVNLINQRFPGVQATSVQMLAHEMEEMRAEPEEINERSRQLEDEGHFPEDALAMALKQFTTRIHAPTGYLMVRVRNIQGDSILTLMDVQEYRQASGY